MFKVLLFFRESVNGLHHLAHATSEPLLDDVEHQIINHQNQGLGHVSADNTHTQSLIIPNIMRKPNSVIVVFFLFTFFNWYILF